MKRRNWYLISIAALMARSGHAFIERFTRTLDEEVKKMERTRIKPAKFMTLCGLYFSVMQELF